MKIRYIFPASLFLLLIGCGPSTMIEKSWTDPSFTAAMAKPFQKILVMGLFRDASTRRIAEDKMVAAMKTTGVQSYNYLTSTDTSRAEVDAKLVKDGFDGVVIMRLADVDKNMSYVPGTGYGGWYGYYYGSPGYYQENRIFYIETNIYSLESKKLLWSATTSTMNPSKVEKTLDEVIAAIKEKMQQQGLMSR